MWEIGTLSLLTLAVSLSAQTAAFEAASIKLNTSGPGPSSMRVTAGRVAMENVTLKKVLLNAYGIADDREYAVIGSDSLTTDRFNISATFPADTKTDQVREMMKSLLADRFKMALHKETRQLPNYTLVVAKGGPKITAAEPGQSQTSGGAGHFVAAKTSMQHFADLLARLAGQPVVNGTGLEGVYTFTLDWSPAAALKVDTADAPGTSTGPSIFTALQEQLGLRLDSGKGPSEVLVIDRMEKLPTDN